MFIVLGSVVQHILSENQFTLNVYSFRIIFVDDRGISFVCYIYTDFLHFTTKIYMKRSQSLRLF